MSVNRVILVGNVGKDPDIRYIDTGVAVANFTLATTDRGYTMANGTIVPDKTDWHNIVVWRKSIQIVEKYVKKGTKLYVEGKIRTRSYEDASGNTRYITEIICDHLELMDRRPEPAAPEYRERQSTEVHAPTIDNSLTKEDDLEDLPF